MTLARPGGTCSVCGVSIDRRAKTCRTHATSHLTPDHQRAAIAKRWQKKETLVTDWTEITDDLDRIYRRETPIGTIQVNLNTAWKSGMASDVFLMPDYRQIGVFHRSRESGTWQATALAHQGFRLEKGTENAYTETGFPDWPDAAWWIVTQTDTIMAEHSIAPERTR